LIILSLFYNKIYKNENTESSIILNKIRSLLGESSEHGFREHRPCYIHGRNHVGISDVAKCGKVSWPTSQNNKIFFTVTIVSAVMKQSLHLTRRGYVSRYHISYYDCARVNIHVCMKNKLNSVKLLLHITKQNPKYVHTSTSFFETDRL